MGDGLLLEFPSVVDATTCGIEMQNGMAARNEVIAGDNRIVFRIGINLGDIIIEGEDILGDGVNIAARIEASAEPGGIAISARVHDDVRDRLEAQFVDGGEQNLKNISRPVRVWHWAPRTISVPNIKGALALPDVPSIAVLPFENMSSDSEQEYFSDGISEDIITEISRFRDFLVIARNSSFAYKGEQADIKQISRELGVHYLLQGSVRRGGDRVRITAQLIDAESGSHLWAERYDRDLADIFAVQDEIATTIAGTLGASITDAEQARAVQKAPTNLDAYDHALRGLSLLLEWTRQSVEDGRRECEAALALDPKYAFAHMMLALSHSISAWSGEADDPVAALEIARRAARAAVTLDNTDDRTHAILGQTELWLRNHDRAVFEGRRAIELNPNNADTQAWFAITLNFVGEPKVGLNAIETAKRLNPHQPTWYLHTECRSLFMLERYEDVLSVGGSVVAESPEFTMNFALLAASYAALGQSENAKVQPEKIKQISPAFTISYVPNVVPYKHPGDLAIFVNWLREAGLPE